MYLLDFIYRDIKLSDLGYMVGFINSSNDSSISLGSNIAQQRIKNNSTFKQELASSTYDETITATFDIFKKICDDNTDTFFTDSEISYIMRWLNSKTDEDFSPLYDDDSYPNIYFKGSFTTINAIHLAGGVVGFSLTFTSNAPFGYEAMMTEKYTISKANDSFEIYNGSDEIGYLYPEYVKITVSQTGNLLITNMLDDVGVEIKNCKNGNIIEMDCEHKIITGTVDNLYNNFNYNFFRLVSTFDKQDNKFTVSLPCTIEIKYSPIRKVGIMV